MTVDGMFPRLSPNGRNLMSGSANLFINGQLAVENAISGAWLNDVELLYLQHSSGDLYRYNIETRKSEAVGPKNCGHVAANRHGLWAVNYGGPDGHPIVTASDGRTWLDKGGGFRPLHVGDDGSIYFGEHDANVLYRVEPNGTRLVVIDPEGGNYCRSWREGVVYQKNNQAWHYSFKTGFSTNLSFPGQDEFGPVVVDLPTGPWLLTHTHKRLIVRPLFSKWGIVLDESANTFYPDAAWDGERIRVCWSEGLGWPPPRGTAGTPHELFVDFEARRVDLSLLPYTVPPGPGWEELPDTQIDVARYLCGFVSHARNGSLYATPDGRVYTHLFQLDAHRTDGWTQVIKNPDGSNRAVWTYNEVGVGLAFDLNPDFPQGYAICHRGTNEVAPIFPRSMKPGQEVRTPVDVVSLADARRWSHTFIATLVMVYAKQAVGHLPPLQHAIFRYNFDHAAGFTEDHICLEGYGNWAWHEVDKPTGDWRRWEAVAFVPMIQAPAVPPEHRKLPVKPQEKPVNWYNDKDAKAFGDWLELKYAQHLGRDAAKPVDTLGWFRWVNDYIRERDKGAGHDSALRAVNTAINRIIGRPDHDMPVPEGGQVEPNPR